MEDLRSQLVDLLSRWEAGALDERGVHERAETLWSSHDGPRDVPPDDAASIPLEVASHLELLNHQLIIVDDIPAIRRFLDTRPGNEAEGWRLWRAYWGAVDFDARKSALKKNPYYTT